MSIEIHFKNAPITEAIFDIRVNSQDKIKIEDFDNAHKLISVEYPKKIVPSIMRQNWELLLALQHQQQKK